MEERIIIEGKPAKKTSLMLLKIGLILVAVGLVLFLMTVNTSPRVLWHRETNYMYLGVYFNALGDYLAFSTGRLFYVSLLLDLGIILSIYSLILWLAIKDDCITVTNKRVYGVTKWKKRVDLPLKQISAVSTSWLKGVAVGTSSGKIDFKEIENYIDVHKEITNLLAAKEDTTVVSTIQTANDDIEDLKKLKDLLDSNIITQEEFDAKKKQLLGL